MPQYFARNSPHLIVKFPRKEEYPVRDRHPQRKTASIVWFSITFGSRRSELRARNASSQLFEMASELQLNTNPRHHGYEGTISAFRRQALPGSSAAHSPWFAEQAVRRNDRLPERQLRPLLRNPQRYQRRSESPIANSPSRLPSRA